MNDLKVTAEHVTSWNLAYELALATEGKVPTKSPDAVWVRKILRAEHSPIRAKYYLVKIENCPYWVSVHLVRHKIGVEWFVSTQRDDRNNNEVSRADMPQSTPVNVTMLANAQALINISRKRLCRKASEETRAVWHCVRGAIAKIDASMAMFMVPECGYRGRCPEIRSCVKDDKNN